MATVRLIASSCDTTNATVSNETNMFTDISSDTYGTFYTSSAAGWIDIFNFDFSLVPDGVNIVSVKYKIKILTKTPVCSVKLKKLSTSSVDLCDAIVVPNDNEAHIIELTPSVDFNTIKNYPDWSRGHSFAFSISCDANSASHRIYGAEIAVTYNVGINEVIFGDEPLIDLTSDTATASDVLSGKTFHLANGFQATGEYVPPVLSVNKKTATASSSAASLAFTGLTKAPSFFVALPNSSIDITYVGSRTICVLYNGETTYRIYATYRNGSTRVSVKASSASFTYSSGTLTVKVSGSIYLLDGDWNLFYI